MEKKVVTIIASPYASQYGTIEVDKDVNVDDAYLKEHFSDIMFDEPELDYRGTDFEIIND